MGARRVQISLDDSLVTEIHRRAGVRRQDHAGMREACIAVNVALGCR